MLIRPKMSLADDDNYRERRYFTAWTKLKQIEDHVLPDFIQKITTLRTDFNNINAFRRLPENA